MQLAALLDRNQRHIQRHRLAVDFSERHERQLKRAQIEHIIKSQLTDKESFEKADYILENNEKSLLLPEVIDLYEKIRKKVC